MIIYSLPVNSGLIKLKPSNSDWSMFWIIVLSVGVSAMLSLVNSGSKLSADLYDFYNVISEKKIVWHVFVISYINIIYI